MLARTPLTRYAKVRNFAGFQASIVSILQEYTSAGGTLEHLHNAEVESDFIRVVEAILTELKGRNLHLRAGQLRHAAARIAEAGCPGTSEFFAGFYSFTAPELEVIRALAGRVQMTIAVAEWAAHSRRRCLGFSRHEYRSAHGATADGQSRLFCRSDFGRGSSEIARRMIQAHDNGRPWREMGVLVRNETTYVPALGRPSSDSASRRVSTSRPR